MNISQNLPHCYNCVYSYDKNKSQEFWRCSQYGYYCDIVKSPIVGRCGAVARWKSFVSKDSNPPRKNWFKRLFNF